MRIHEPTKTDDGRIWRGRFDLVTRLLHWATVGLVLFQLASGWSLSMAGARYAPLLLAHRSLGSALWAITLLRWCWRSSFARFPPFPEKLPRLMRWAAQLSEYTLYALLLLQPAAGMADTLLRGRPFAIAVWTVPALLPRDVDLALRFHRVHMWGAWALAGVAGTHALAALFHHIVLKDDVMEAMLLWTGRKPAPVRRRLPTSSAHPG